MRREGGRRKLLVPGRKGTEIECTDRRMQWYKPTAIFPRILSPRVQSTPICLAASSTNQPVSPQSAAVPVALAPLLQGVAAKREQAGTVLDKSCQEVPIYRDFDRWRRVYGCHHGRREPAFEAN